MPKSAMSISHCIQIEISISQTNFDDQTILVDFIRVAYLHTLPRAIGIPLFYPLLLG
jgi:hypothetical protein